MACVCRYQAGPELRRFARELQHPAAVKSEIRRKEIVRQMEITAAAADALAMVKPETTSQKTPDTTNTATAAKTALISPVSGALLTSTSLKRKHTDSCSLMIPACMQFLPDRLCPGTPGCSLCLLLCGFDWSTLDAHNRKALQKFISQAVLHHIQVIEEKRAPPLCKKSVSLPLQPAKKRAAVTLQSLPISAVLTTSASPPSLLPTPRPLMAFEPDSVVILSSPKQQPQSPPTSPAAKNPFLTPAAHATNMTVSQGSVKAQKAPAPAAYMTFEGETIRIWAEVCFGAKGYELLFDPSEVAWFCGCSDRTHLEGFANERGLITSDAVQTYLAFKHPSKADGFANSVSRVLAALQSLPPL